MNCKLRKCSRRLAARSNQVLWLRRSCRLGLGLRLCSRVRRLRFAMVYPHFFSGCKKALTLVGVSGPLWYAAGATVQILLFATVAIELKRRAPNAHVGIQPILILYMQLRLVDIPRSSPRPLRQSHAFRLHHLRPLHQHPRHGHASDRRISRHQLPDWRTHRSSLFSAATRRRGVHHVWWHQGDLPHRLRAYRHSACHPIDIRVHHVCDWR